MAFHHRQSLSTSFWFISLATLLCVSFCVTEGRSPFACDPRNGLTRNLRFCRAALPIHVRVQDLIGRLTLQEKVGLLVNNAAAVPRLGIRGYEWWSEALHGVSNTGPGVKFGGAFHGATSFPQVITTAASFNESLWEEIGRSLVLVGPVRRPKRVIWQRLHMVGCTLFAPAVLCASPKDEVKIRKTLQKDRCEKAVWTKVSHKHANFACL